MFFKIQQKDTKTNARVGKITTPHGEVLTPGYAIVGTHAEVRCLTPHDLRSTNTQLIIANTYHLWRTLGDELSLFEGLHARMQFNGVIMTDSGGFQVFSLGFAREHGVGKIASIFPEEDNMTVRSAQENLVRITDQGAFFTEHDKEYYLDAETSIMIQEKLGADIILAFDECTSPLHDYTYTAQALLRTHAWAVRCLNAKTRNDQMLYGIVQGGSFPDLRKSSASYIGSLPFHGFAIGGSLGKSREDMFQVIDWTIPYLPDEKPRHLLGIGRIEDLFEGVARGIDTFDCVIPTREARHGSLWTSQGRFDVKRARDGDHDILIEEGCGCPVCALWKISRKSLRTLFKERHPDASRFATMHNVYFFNTLMTQIRAAILDGNFLEFKNEWYSRINAQKNKSHIL